MASVFPHISVEEFEAESREYTDLALKELYQNVQSEPASIDETTYFKERFLSIAQVRVDKNKMTRYMIGFLFPLFMFRRQQNSTTTHLRLVLGVSYVTVLLHTLLSFLITIDYISSDDIYSSSYVLWSPIVMYTMFAVLYSAQKSTLIVRHPSFISLKNKHSATRCEFNGVELSLWEVLCILEGRLSVAEVRSVRGLVPSLADGSSSSDEAEDNSLHGSDDEVFSNEESDICTDYNDHSNDDDEKALDRHSSFDEELLLSKKIHGTAFLQYQENSRFLVFVQYIAAFLIAVVHSLIPLYSTRERMDLIPISSSILCSGLSFYLLLSYMVFANAVFGIFLLELFHAITSMHNSLKVFQRFSAASRSKHDARSSLLPFFDMSIREHIFAWHRVRKLILSAATESTTNFQVALVVMASFVLVASSLLLLRLVVGWNAVSVVDALLAFHCAVLGGILLLGMLITSEIGRHQKNQIACLSAGLWKVQRDAPSASPVPFSLPRSHSSASPVHLPAEGSSFSTVSPSPLAVGRVSRASRRQSMPFKGSTPIAASPSLQRIAVSRRNHHSPATPLFLSATTSSSPRQSGAYDRHAASPYQSPMHQSSSFLSAASPLEVDLHATMSQRDLLLSLKSKLTHRDVRFCMIGVPIDYGRLLKVLSFIAAGLGSLAGRYISHI